MAKENQQMSTLKQHQVLQLLDKGFISAIIKMFLEKKEKMKNLSKNRSYKEELDRNFRTVKTSN